MRTVHIRIEGDIECADDLSDDDLLQMLRREPHWLKAETYRVEIVSSSASGEVSK